MVLGGALLPESLGTAIHRIAPWEGHDDTRRVR